MSVCRILIVFLITKFSDYLNITVIYIYKKFESQFNTYLTIEILYLKRICIK